MGGLKYLALFYWLRYFDHTINGYGLIHLKTKNNGFEIAFFYMDLGLIPTNHEFLMNGRPKISWLVLLVEMF
jgi:hypothetical protein